MSGQWVRWTLVVAADTIAAAWAGLDGATKADTVAYVVVTDGSDLNVYST